MYQIYPRSFQDSNHDGVGDVRGIINRLDYLKELGVDALWISPFYPSPMNDFGYDVSDYCGVDPLFGSLEDCDALIHAADKQGIKILLDLVFSHTASAHPWFQESRHNKTNPKADYYVWADPQPDGSPPNNWLAHFGGPAWDWDSKRGQYYLHNFLKSMPDLNVHNPQVQDELLSVMRFWLDRGVKGFRLDVLDYYCHDPKLTNNPPLSAGKKPKRYEPYMMQEHRFNRNHDAVFPFIARMRSLCDAYGDIMMVAEISEAGGVEASAVYTNGHDRLHTSYNFDLLSKDFSPLHIRQTLERFKELSPAGWPSWSFSNHDTVRVASRWGGLDPDPAFIKMVNALLVALPGTVYVYQGQELGLEDVDVPYAQMKDPYGLFQYPENKGRDGCRTPMIWDSTAGVGFSEAEPWLPYGDKNRHKSVAHQSRDPDSVLVHFKTMMVLRQNQPCLRWGDIDFIYADDGLLVFDRPYQGSVCRCVFNLSQTERSIDPYVGQKILHHQGVEGHILHPHGYGLWTIEPKKD